MSQTPVPLMDCRREYEALRAEHDATIAFVLNSGQYLFGPETRRFEQAFAEFCGIQHVIGVGCGTDALELALRAVGCGPGMEVIVPPNAGMYASAAAILAGATPVYADVSRDSLLISPESVGRMITERTAVVVATHLFGRLCDVKALRRVIGDRPVRIIEDCAQAHGAAREGHVAGSLGDVAAFSFYPTKNLGALGDGGAVATNSASVAEAVRRLAQYGWTRRYNAVQPGGRNSRLDEIQAAVLNVRLPHLRERNQARRHIVSQYIAAAAGTGLTVVSSPSEQDVCHLCVVRHPDRGRVREHFEQHGIATSIHYPVLDNDQPALRDVPWKSDDLAEASSARDEILTLPCFPHMNPDEIERVCGAIRGLE